MMMKENDNGFRELRNKNQDEKILCSALVGKGRDGRWKC